MERVAQHAVAQVELGESPATARRRRRGPLLKVIWLTLLALGFAMGALLGDLSQGVARNGGAPQEPEVVATTQTSTEVAEPEVVQRLARLVHEKRWVEARLQGIDCVRNNPSMSSCHKLLGTTYAKLGEPQMAASEYREFVKQAPNHPDAEKVRQILDGYEAPPE